MKIGIIGLGLIGGSLGRALVKKTEHKVHAFDTDAQAMVKGRLLSAYHEQLDRSAAAELDILIIALYPAAAAECLEIYAPLMKSGSIVADCAGTKRMIAAKMRGLKEKYPDVNFIGAHPMAGKEFSGIRHSSAALFENASVLFVPAGADISALSRLKKIFLEAGAERVAVTGAGEHDEMIAYTSQLAHIVSSAYIDNEKAGRHYGFTAGSFRDMTRVARLNPEMWTELMTENGDNLTVELDKLIGNLTAFREAVSKRDARSLKELLDKGNKIKLGIETGAKVKSEK